MYVSLRENLPHSKPYSPKPISRGMRFQKENQNGICSLGTPKPHGPALLLVAIFSRHEQALDWVLARIARDWGAAGIVSERFEFSETQYYAREMGEQLKKQFLVGQDLFDPQWLPARKLQSNSWELEYANLGIAPEPRPLNIDPGYVTLTKLVLASTKDRAHRLYMADGIYAEESLFYLDGRWQGRPWTYPDYLRADFHAFFDKARELLKERSCRRT